MSTFVLNKIVLTNVQDTVKHFTAALKDEGFGVLSTHDFSEIIASKTGHPFKGRVVGLGSACPSWPARPWNSIRPWWPSCHVTSSWLKRQRERPSASWISTLRSA